MSDERHIARALQGLPARRGMRTLVGDALVLPRASGNGRREVTIAVRCDCGEHQRLSATTWRHGRCGDRCKRCCLERLWIRTRRQQGERRERRAA